MAACSLLVLIVFEIFCFTKYYDGFVLTPLIQNRSVVKLLKTFALGVPSYLLSGLFLWAAVISPYRYRLVYFFIFALGAFVEFSYQASFNRYTNSEDLANVLFAADERILFNSAAVYFSPLALIPCAAFAVILMAVRPGSTGGLKILSVVLAALSIFYIFTGYLSTNSYPSTSFAAFYRTAIAFPINWYAGSLTMPAMANFYDKPREKINFAAAARPRNNIVFIVDESVRSDHLSVNGYMRPTTPFLENLSNRGFLKNWGTAVSGTTCSVTSNNLLLTGVTDLPDISGGVFRYPTIFQYAKAMGYSTHYIDGQMTYRWIGKKRDAEDIDEWLTVKDIAHDDWYDVDRAIGTRVRETVENSTGNFIWINKFGVHAPYFPSYPQSETTWLPVPADRKVIDLFRPVRVPEETINSYDNAIHYNLESFFPALVGGTPAGATYYVYTSDHGQNLGEEGKSLTHCSTTPYEAMVPLFIISRPELIPPVDVNFKASHSNIFATLLDLMNFPENERRPYSISLLKAKEADSTPRHYFEGNLNGRFANSVNLYDR